MMKRLLEICVDFDGTCVTHEFPKVGKEIGAPKVLKKLTDAGHKLILFTMRSNFKGTYLTDAVNWFKKHNIPLWGINTNPKQSEWTTSPKAHGNLFIDDLSLNAPVTYNKDISDIPYIDWVFVENYLIKMRLID